jgi:hypothetical protein
MQENTGNTGIMVEFGRNQWNTGIPVNIPRGMPKNIGFLWCPQNGFLWKIPAGNAGIQRSPEDSFFYCIFFQKNPVKKGKYNLLWGCYVFIPLRIPSI